MEATPNVLADPALAGEGARRVAWARENMPLLRGLRTAFEHERPLAGRRIGMCLHTEQKTAVLIEALRAGGAEMFVTGSPATTDDGVAAALARDPGIHVYARKTDTLDDHYGHVERILDAEPDFLVDNGADLIAGTIARGGGRVTAATEETTSGANRLRGELEGRIPFPVVVINDSPLKQLIENQYGIGPAVLDGFNRATNTVVAAKTFVVFGYGTCGRSLAKVLRNLGAVVTVVEIDPVRALEAAYDGMRVMHIEPALEEADGLFTVTGRPGIVRREHFPLLKDGALLGNVGHFGNEIDVAALEELAVERRELRDHVVEYLLPGGSRVRLLARGEMLNLSAANGHPIEVMDLGFALQAHSIRALARDPAAFVHGAQPVPAAINRAIGAEMLRTLSTTRLAPLPQ